MFQPYFADSVLFVVPNEVKEILLKEISKQKKLYQMTFLSLEEFKKHYFFEIKKEESLAFLTSRFQTNPSVLEEKLDLLYGINPTKKYKNHKLKELVQIYQLLEEEKLLIKDTTFSKFIKKFKIYVFGYPLLEPYEKKMFENCGGTLLSYPAASSFPSIFRFEKQEDEIVFIAGKMRTLHQQGISYQKMILSGVGQEDVYLIRQIFQKFNIPIMGLEHPNLYATNIGKQYYEEQDVSIIQDISIKKKIIAIENQLLKIPKTHPIYSYLLKEALKETSLDLPYYEDAVQVMDFYHLVPQQDTYTFVIGFNQNILPKVLKDENYLNDRDIEELDIASTALKNKVYKETTLAILKSLPNLTVSYREKTLSNSFYPSSCIEEFHLPVLENDKSYYPYSQSYSLIRLGEMLDQYYLYGIKQKDLNQLSLSLPTIYRSYQHQFQPIPFRLREDQPYSLSYSSLNDYALCKFQYYAKYILKAEEQKPSFAATLGNIYHQVLMHMYDKAFDFEEEWEKAVSSYTLSKKEQVLLRRLKKELQFIIPVIEEQDSKSAFQARLFEQKIEVPLGDNVFLKGIIDKIAFCELYGKIHYAIYDYKTGNVTLDLTHIDDGLFLQLPLYQVLLEKGKLFKNPHFTGFFYQQLLLPSKNQQEKISNLKLRGYVTNDEESLSIFDETYENSEVIKGLKMTTNGFSKNSKILTEEESQALKEKTWKKVLEMKKEILQGDFTINPKRLKGKEISCTYCPFADICFHDEKDYVEIKEEEVV